MSKRSKQVAHGKPTKLDSLNALLASNAKALNIPDHHTHVDPSGSSLKWLRKASRRSQFPAEIVGLLELTVHELLEPADGQY